MAKKLRELSDPNKAPVYPWLRLLEMEVQPEERPALPRGRGRPANRFPRKAVHVTLTEDELAALDELADLISGGINIHLHRGHVIAFLTFYLRSRLLKGEGIGLPEGVNSLSDLARYLDKLKD
jgi:hypothetical protein